MIYDWYVSFANMEQSTFEYCVRHAGSGRRTEHGRCLRWSDLPRFLCYRRKLWNRKLVSRGGQLEFIFMFPSFLLSLWLKNLKPWTGNEFWACDDYRYRVIAAGWTWFQDAWIQVHQIMTHSPMLTMDLARWNQTRRRNDILLFDVNNVGRKMGAWLLNETTKPQPHRKIFANISDMFMDTQIFC